MATDFWRQHPAILYGVAALLGAALSLQSLPPFLLALFALATCCTLTRLCTIYGRVFEREAIYRVINFAGRGCFPLPRNLFSCRKPPSEDEFKNCTKSSLNFKSKIALFILFLFASFILTETRYLFPSNLPIKGGIAEVDIDEVSLSKSPFGDIWKYGGTLKSYILDGKLIAKGIPIEATVPIDQLGARPLSGLRYELQGTLKEKSHGGYTFKSNGKPWVPTDHLYSLSEIRYKAKSALKKHLQASIEDKHVGEFLIGIATGEFDDMQLTSELQRFGLIHLTAISGLHFSIISTFLAFTFFQFLSRKAASIGVIIFMTLYFVFLGASPSVARAWISVTLGLASLLLCRQSSPLNSIGVGGAAVILFNPLAIHDIGFQFSFAITLSILLWSKPCGQLLEKAFHLRPLGHAIKMSALNQHAYCLLHFLKQALSLSFAVNIAALPLTLFYFHKFPMMGLLYNLFFPPLVTMSLLLLLLGVLTSPLPYLAGFFHATNERYTQMILNFGFHLPKSVDACSIETQGIPAEFIAIYLFCLFLLGFYAHLAFDEKLPFRR